LQSLFNFEEVFSFKIRNECFSVIVFCADQCQQSNLVPSSGKPNHSEQGFSSASALLPATEVEAELDKNRGFENFAEECSGEVNGGK